jgi:hypothetical protein
MELEFAELTLEAISAGVPIDFGRHGRAWVIAGVVYDAAALLLPPQVGP